ncbi:O-succinylhomoserine sulfhydrylase [Kiloniella laminariae]|uniref:O-succinylhomoserine sulfhydrylase n=2 Tax=Kiloniella laminariae TaxID=454162 RepID=A0ABT4LII0_9PROT|nr:O-succinylhomoserine sulfhydrylase [Kiloniella laminariae]MCZ4280913.1 O-succinylhomoserine sulfhydrylase [Kiloniella laminariae]
MTDNTSKVSAGRLRPQTELVRGGLMRSGFDETSEAMFLNSGYVYSSAEEAEQAFNGERERYVYSRYANPTLSMFEERMRLLEGAEVCRGTASGMAAVNAALLSQVKAGDRVVGAKALFGSCLYILNELLPRYGVETEVVDGTDLKAWESALSKGAKAVLVETPSNPALDIIDLKAVCDMAHAAGALVIVDNVFATPMLQKPLEYGADIVVYSTTKHIDGQGRCMGGAILCSKEFDADHLKDFYRHTGPSMSPFNAWTMLKGLETLGLRVDRMSDNALALASHLETLPGLRKVIYPGLKSHPQHELAMAQMSGKGSTLIGLELDGGKEAAFKVLNRLRVADISNNLGDAKTLITHPSSTTHQRLSEEERLAVGITQSFLRISVGLEDVEDLKEDLEQAIRG